LPLGATTRSRCPPSRHQGAARSGWRSLHFDAHPDTWDTYFGAPFTHGNAVPQGGRRGVARARARRPTSACGGPLYAQRDLDDDRALASQPSRRRTSPGSGTDEVVDRIRQRVGNLPVYLSIDVDVPTRRARPGLPGTPEPGGPHHPGAANIVAPALSASTSSARTSSRWHPPTTTRS